MDFETFVATKVTRTDKPGSVTFSFRAGGNNVQSVTYSRGVFNLSPKKRTVEAQGLLHEYFILRQAASSLVFRKHSVKKQQG